MTPGYTVRTARPADLPSAQAMIRQVLHEDLGYPYRPDWFFDVDDPQTQYLDNPRHALLVAVEDRSGAVVGTAGVMNLGPNAPPHPPWLSERYTRPDVAQLFRVYVQRDHRRRGLAAALVAAARRFVAEEGGYSVIYLPR